MNTAKELRQELTGIINVLPYHKLEALLVLIRNDEDLEDTLTPEEEAIVRQRSAEHAADPSCSIPLEVILAEDEAGRDLTPEEAAEIEHKIKPDIPLGNLMEKYRKLAEWEREQDELDAREQRT
jgi:hypothetical protein